MGDFDKILLEVFGDKIKGISPDLRRRFRNFWNSAVELASDTEHTCANFDPTTEGPVGPENCEACELFE